MWFLSLCASVGFLWCAKKVFVTYVLPWNESRNDKVVLKDAIHDAIVPLNTNPCIGFLTLFHLLLLCYPGDVNVIIRHNVSMTIIYILKSVTLFLCPLAAPSDMIP